MASSPLRRIRTWAPVRMAARSEASRRRRGDCGVTRTVVVVPSGRWRVMALSVELTLTTRPAITVRASAPSLKPVKPALLVPALTTASRRVHRRRSCRRRRSRRRGSRRRSRGDDDGGYYDERGCTAVHFGTEPLRLGDGYGHSGRRWSAGGAGRRRLAVAGVSADGTMGRRASTGA